MKCEGCGAELAEGAKTCQACGRPVGMAQRAEMGTVNVAHKTEAVAEKVGDKLFGGMKSLGSDVKKKIKHSDEPKSG